MEKHYYKRCINLSCNLCNNENPQIKQTFIEDGIEKTIEYCNNCFKDIQKNHLNKMSKNSSKNIKIISNYGDKLVSDKAYKNITFDPYHEKIVTELPLHILKAIFISDEYSVKRNEKNSISRNLKYLELSLIKAQNYNDESRIKRLQKLIEFFKSIK